MLPVSLDCPFLIAPSVFYNVYSVTERQNYLLFMDKQMYKDEIKIVFIKT